MTCIDTGAFLARYLPADQHHKAIARRSRNHRSAELYSAVSRICNPLAASEADDLATAGAPPNAIRRYSRLQICATRAPRQKSLQQCAKLGDSTATALWNKIRSTHERCVTGNFVLDETFTLLARRASYSFAAEKARIIYAASSLEILRPDSLTELAALNWFEKFADQEVSFTDCVSFALMREADIRTAFSFDSHFERAGFKKWK